MPDGKICYLEIPAADIGVSERGDGQRASDDTTGAVSSARVLGLYEEPAS
ncbi:MAG: hypothetical protein ACRD16_04580 [Thermoanaerobaculia bacterium]